MRIVSESSSASLMIASSVMFSSVKASVVLIVTDSRVGAVFKIIIGEDATQLDQSIPS